MPNFDVGGGSDPFFDVCLGVAGKHVVYDWLKVSSDVCTVRSTRGRAGRSPAGARQHVGHTLNQRQTLQSASHAQDNNGKVKHYRPKHRIIDFDVWDRNVRVKGDVKVRRLERWSRILLSHMCRVASPMLSPLRVPFHRPSTPRTVAVGFLRLRPDVEAGEDVSRVVRRAARRNTWLTHEAHTKTHYSAHPTPASQVQHRLYR